MNTNSKFAPSGTVGGSVVTDGDLDGFTEGLVRHQLRLYLRQHLSYGRLLAITILLTDG